MISARWEDEGYCDPWRVPGPKAEQQRTVRSGHLPSCPSPCVHIPIYKFIYPIRLFVIGFICSPSKETIFVVRVLELVGIYFRLFAAPRLRLPVE